MSGTHPSLESIVTLGDGSRVLVRPIRPEDKDKLLEGFKRLSPRSRYLRFLRPMQRLGEKELRYLTEIDYADHFAWAAQAIDAEDQPGVAIGRYIRERDDPAVAEAAIVVSDEYQGRGLGSLILRKLIESAMNNGITTFRAFVLAENRPGIDLVKSFGAQVADRDGPVLQMDIDLPAAYEGSGMQQALRAAASGELTTEPGD